MAEDRVGEALRISAAAIGLALPPETLEGVRANAVLLEAHAAKLADFPLPDDPHP
ncbi:AtzG-like protein [Sphingomonas montanisoli]|nr:AtzG-like protein [Sphingomonas montanisoli]